METLQYRRRKQHERKRNERESRKIHLIQGALIDIEGKKRELDELFEILE